MPAHRHRQRPDLAAGGNCFSFSDQLEYETWAERIKTNDRNSFGKRDDDRKVGPWARRIPPPVAGEEVRWPLSATGPLLGAEMIARYRRDMMDLVRSMPEEAAYELSLKDIVELPAPAPTPAPVIAEKPEKEKGRPEDKLALTKKGKKKSATRSESVDAVGSLLNRLMLRAPAVVSRRRRNSGVGGGGAGAKVTPKPVADGGEDGSTSERSSSNGNSSSSGSRGGGIRIKGKMSSCYLFWKKDRSRSWES